MLPLLATLVVAQDTGRSYNGRDHQLHASIPRLEAPALVDGILDCNIDLNPDYVFESRGRLVPGGYDIEIRIPFKSLRYQEGAVQNWGLHVLRRIQHSGFQDSWAPALRANASFLIQEGVLEG